MHNKSLQWKVISDKQSVVLGTEMLILSWNAVSKEVEAANSRLPEPQRQPTVPLMNSIVQKVAHSYNPDYTYSSDVVECARFIRTKLWNNLE